jgi:hypothetical protein
MSAMLSYNPLRRTIVLIEHPTPRLIAHLGRPPRGIDDIGEEHRC